MLQQIYESRYTIITVLVLALLIFLAIRKIVKDRKAGIGPCGGKCAECAHAAACGRAQAVPQNEEQTAPPPAECSGICKGCPYSAQCHKPE